MEKSIKSRMNRLSELIILIWLAAFAVTLFLRDKSRCDCPKMDFRRLDDRLKVFNTYDFLSKIPRGFESQRDVQCSIEYPELNIQIVEIQH